MRRLLFVLAWADCQDASWLLAAGDRRGAARRVQMAIEKVEEAVIVGRGPPIWRPTVRMRSGRIDSD